jgi:hypothetical protein
MYSIIPPKRISGKIQATRVPREVTEALRDRTAMIRGTKISIELIPRRRLKLVVSNGDAL